MFQTISNFMRVRDIRNKIIFTLLMLVVFRIGTFIPVPYVDADVLKQTDQLGLIGFLNTFGGGALAELLYFSNGYYAIHHSFYYCTVITNGRCS